MKPIKKEKVENTKSKGLDQIKTILLNRGNPRFQMFVILSATFLSATLSSIVLLNLGISLMYIRYPIAIFIGYLSFFLFLRIWVFFAFKSMNLHPDESFNLLRIDSNKFNSSSDINFSSAPYDFLFDHEQAFLIKLFLILTLSILVIFGYVIFISPIFLSELVFESFALTFVYKKIKNYQRVGWYGVVIKNTIVPFLILLAIFTFIAFIIQSALPEIKSMGDLINSLKANN
ncbi:hypothetical protein ND861_18905 [Leptospira sp. 2 VSF19]|uniref:Uncharacterized protein n=1 Tax=Leptospira soteropolitanensis TaxID=2950025 RepID=A0AAW5VQA4_9LEPT|nr:hypothetical protein [Leptospira soteropolitanensis]MCW7494736.1 hypothetical protein [Leptospira soteropolitanensis]MCW7502338.1 hypothetical protein [Leptospira soteropolitanensis]MCW7524565.1 hypothetical protein [Leptospira soteropolitanensis]MCW7528435.1 hypothetical protein [Leptospira soteropolitanensis]MCW7532305.1 hypothetical protein [Leptospira soteropolitanensis]